MPRFAYAAVLILLSGWASPTLAQKSGAPTAAQKKAAATVEAERGKIVAKPVRFGGYFQYLPNRAATGVLVLIHGQPTGNDIQDIPALARRFAERWVPFAEEHGLIALVPVFNDENFDSVSGNQGGGYRALHGRQIGADVYVNEIVARYKTVAPAPWDGRFVLYGHSAGGQFASRYTVKHPDRLRVLLISAAGQYAMPESNVAWPNGMAPLNRTLYWGPNREPQHISITPSPQGWLKAATLFPTTVVVGANDTEPQTTRDGHASLLRTERATQWVNSMNQLAERQNKPGRVSLVVVPGIGHDSAGLTPAAQKAIDEFLAKP